MLPIWFIEYVHRLDMILMEKIEKFTTLRGNVNYISREAFHVFRKKPFANSIIWLFWGGGGGGGGVGGGGIKL